MNMFKMLTTIADYYKKKSEEFAGIYDIPFGPFEQNVLQKSQGPADYIENLLNGIIDKVAQKTGRSFEDVKEEYVRRYI